MKAEVELTITFEDSAEIDLRVRGPSIRTLDLTRAVLTAARDIRDALVKKPPEPSAVEANVILTPTIVGGP